MDYGQNRKEFCPQLSSEGLPDTFAGKNARATPSDLSLDVRPDYPNTGSFFKSAAAPAPARICRTRS